MESAKVVYHTIYLNETKI